MDLQSSQLDNNQEKLWKDATNSEKIEKLKEYVEGFSYLNRVISELKSEIRRMNQHSHKENGEVMVPISSVNSVGIGGLVGTNSRKSPLA